MNGAERFLAALAAGGVRVAFGIPGGAVLPFVDAMTASPIRLVVTRNEASAAHAADGYARATGRVGVCLATSGPGGTNLLTGLSTAQADSVPILAVVGQVPLPLIGTDAFQETDVFGMSLGITKRSYRLTHPDEIGGVVAEALRVAVAGRPGPVLIEFPKDVQTAPVTGDAPRPPLPPPPRPSPLRWARARSLLRQSRRPVIYIGGGVVASDTAAWVQELALRLDAPVVSTLMGLGAMPSGHPLFLGMLGMHGTWTANHAVAACDLLIAVGARFDDRVTGKVSEFAAGARILHLEVDPAEVGKIVEPDVALVGDLRETLPRLVREARRQRHADWWRTLRRWQAEHPLRVPTAASGEGVPTPRVMTALGEVLDPEDVVATEVGQHQMWAALFLPRARPRTFLTSGGTGTMGYGLPAALGAAFGVGPRRVAAILGDGSFQMNLQELATLVQYRVPVLLLVLNNRGHGMVRQWQDLFYEGRRHGSDLVNPDFVKVAEAYGIPGRRAETEDELAQALTDWRAQGGPFLVEVRVPTTEPVFPMVPSGEPITAVREG
jgi:acetolactate synthase-1/2/3 large subunit